MTAMCTWRWSPWLAHPVVMELWSLPRFSSTRALFTEAGLGKKEPFSQHWNLHPKGSSCLHFLPIYHEGNGSAFREDCIAQWHWWNQKTPSTRGGGNSSIIFYSLYFIKFVSRIAPDHCLLKNGIRGLEIEFQIETKGCGKSHFK